VAHITDGLLKNGSRRGEPGFTPAFIARAARRGAKQKILISILARRR
jgi:hypothetical protein